MSLRDDWKATGSGLGHAFRDLGKTIGQSAKEGVHKANEFVNGEQPKNNSSEDDVVADTTATEVNEDNK